jgi:membrane protein
MLSALRISKKAAQGFARDQCMLMAAALSFFAFMALLPSIMIAISIFGYVVRGSEAAAMRITELVQRILPVGVSSVNRVVSDIVAERGLTGAMGIVFLVWTGSGVFSQLRHALDVIFNAEARKSFWYRKAMAMLVVLGLTLLLTALGLLLPVWRLIEHYNARVLGWRIAEVPLLTAALSWAGSILVSWLFFALVYKLLPRRKVTWAEALIAGAACGVPWEMARRGFGWYVATLSRRSALYGSLASLVLLLTWILVSFFLFLYGVELIRAMREAPSPAPQPTRPASRDVRHP